MPTSEVTSDCFRAGLWKGHLEKEQTSAALGFTQY